MSRMSISVVINDDDDFDDADPYVAPSGTILGRLGNVFEGITIHADAEYWAKIAAYATRMSTYEYVSEEDESKDD